jgi:hypothetical protein
VFATVALGTGFGSLDSRDHGVVIVGRESDAGRASEFGGAAVILYRVIHE